MKKLLAMDNIKQDHNLISDTLSNYNFRFKKGFSDRVIQRLEQKKLDLFSSFKMVALSSAAAVAILIFSVYLIDGSLDIDALFGLHNYSAEEEFYSLLNF